MDPRADDGGGQFHVFIRCKVMAETRIPLAFLPGCDLVLGAGNSPETGLVYLAYDTGVAFNEDYVELLYRISGRDLALYLYDSNNRPVRDPSGRRVAAGSRWGRDGQGRISASSVRWIRRLDEATCTVFDQQIPLGRTLADDAGRTLDPDTVYEARLVPLLLREDFSDGLDAWSIVD